MTSGITLFGLIFFALFASAKPQKWGKIQHEDFSSPQLSTIELKAIESRPKLPMIFSKKNQIKQQINDTDTPEWKQFKESTYVL